MKVDHKKKTVTLENGTVFHLKRISTLVLERLRADPRGKPVPPVQTVTYANGATAEETNANDPDYLEALQEWRVNQAYRITRYALTEGISDNAPKDFVQRYRELYFPEASDDELKYLWVASFLPDQDAAIELMQIIVGQSVPTEKGFESAKETFQGDGKRVSD